MRKLIFFFAFLMSSYISFGQQLKSPEEFLGYSLGTKYTNHFKILNYFEYAAKLAPKMMQYETYGQTNEGRPLVLAFIASEENLPNLEEIRKNNLRLTGILNDKPGDINAPSIVWLSFNVHGNETSSSEVSMKTLFALLDPNNKQTKEWLKNTVVIIDPCINPDGRERYVNWFKQVGNKIPDPNPLAREHSEPWPGGRTNHYNFDLNRDWAWQTQIETQRRLKIYNQWLPQIHCDYHEQGVNATYYFAPAAEPYNEVITKWQRDFQTSVGKNNAKYFDAHGWLYFTKEVYDLLYPAYGDTYPTYNGAIGFTYEQAGNGSSGVSILKKDGDTLTLKDRIEHHFTTSMSTVEMASANNKKLIEEYKKYFEEASKNGVGMYKTYVVADSNTGKINALKTLLDANGIKYGTIKNKVIKGYNYFSAKEENFTANNALAISSVQPKGTLVKVLFEPRTILTDSVTYDITAWSLPYVYGLQAYAVKERLAIENAMPNPTLAAVNENAYGFIVKFNSFNDAKFLAALLNEKIKSRFAEVDFTINNKFYKKGSLIILKKGNENKMAQFKKLAVDFNVDITAVETGFMDSGFDFGSGKLHFVKSPNVVLLTGKGTNAGAAGEIWHLFEQELNYPITLINADEFNMQCLKNMDVLMMPNGNFKFLSDSIFCVELKNWMAQGGKIIALDEAVAQIAKTNWGLKMKKIEEEEKPSDKKNEKPDEAKLYASLKRYETRERDGITKFIPGAIFKVELDDSHPLAFGYPNFYFTLKQNDNLFEFMKEGWNVGVIKKEQPIAGFVGSKLKDKLIDGTVIGVKQFGNGSLVYFADDIIFRDFWENGKLMLSNAVFLVGQ